MNLHKHKDLLIIGQGIAGTVFSYICLKNNKTFDVVDDGNMNSASAISSGIINPITGRRYVKTWKYETLKEYFLPLYQEMEDFLGISIIHEIEIIRVLRSAGAKNAWDSRTHDSAYTSYMSDKQDKGDFEKITKSNSIGTISGAYRIEIGKLLHAWRVYLMERKKLVETEFNTESLPEIKPVIWRGTHYDRVVICTGAEARKDVLWKDIGFRPVKGEVLIDKTQKYNTEKILHDGISLVPLADGSLWIGSLYDRDFGADEGITDKARKLMLGKIKKTVDYTPTITKHLAAIRPTMQDMRPVLGRHPIHKNLYLLNGLGTKGMSLAPYCATKLYRSIYSDKSVPNEISIQRFYTGRYK